MTDKMKESGETFMPAPEYTFYLYPMNRTDKKNPAWHRTSGTTQ